MARVQKLVIPHNFLLSGGVDGIRVPIEKKIKPPSLRLWMAWLKGLRLRSLRLEAPINKGVNVGLLNDYVGNCARDIVLREGRQ